MSPESSKSERRKSVKSVPPAIEIAQNAKLKPILKIAKQIGLEASDLELFGPYKAKVDLAVLDRFRDRPDGKLILVTGITPTNAGEGKTVTSIGLAQAFCKIKERCVLALREPSLGPVFGIKGGAAGGGYAQVAPMADINLHFTGDLHAVTSAHNLLAALVDNTVHFENPLDIDPERILWRRALDVCDRQLRNCEIGLGGKTNGFPHPSGFDITASSEIMAILALASSLEDLKARLSRIIVAYARDGRPVQAGDLDCIGALVVLLKDALKPNLIQTLENTPAFVHCGPFANIAHGCNSLVATRLAMKLGDYAVTEAGFAADLGAEKFVDIKCRVGGIAPSAVVLVASCRALKVHGGVPMEEIGRTNRRAVEAGFENLRTHAENLAKFGVPIVIAVNRFPTDARAELDQVLHLSQEMGYTAVLSEVAARGGRGGVKLARTVKEIIQAEPNRCRPIYETEWPIKKKIETIAREIYRADGVDYEEAAEMSIQRLESLGFDKMPLCMAKTQLSISDNAKVKGAPRGWRLTVRDVNVSHGAGFLVVLTGKMLLMPGMPSAPNAQKIDILPDGRIVGLF